MKILVVEDERELNKAICDSLESQNWTCDSAYDAFSAEELILEAGFDLVVLDIGLPDGNGLDVLRVIQKERPQTAVLIVSARDSLDDKLEGLQLGADDYITKPFFMAELNARIRAVQRRRFGGTTIIRIGNLEVHIDKHEASVGEIVLSLTPREYDILGVFLANKGRVLSKQAIAEYVWGKDADWLVNAELLYTHIKNLRKKIRDAGGPDCIKSVYGIGYKLVES